MPTVRPPRHLPPEILDDIFKIVQYPSLPSSIYDVLACALVCRAWHARIAIPSSLFAKIVVKHDHDSLTEIHRLAEMIIEAHGYQLDLFSTVDEITICVHELFPLNSFTMPEPLSKLLSALLNAFGKLPTLALDLSTVTTTHPLDAIQKALCPYSESITSLSILNYRRNADPIVELLKNLKNLKNLSFDRLPSSQFTNILSHLTTLHTVCFDHAVWPPPQDPPSEIFDAWPNLRAAHLLGARFAPQLLRIAESCPLLEELRLQQRYRLRNYPAAQHPLPAETYDIDNDLRGGVKKVVEKCKKIRVLAMLNFKSVDDELVEFLAKEASKLEKLALGGCDRVTGRGVDVNKWQELRELDIRGLEEGLIEGWLDGVRKACPKLEIMTGKFE